MFSRFSCKASHIPHIDDKGVIICIVNLSVDALFLYLAQIIGRSNDIKVMEISPEKACKKYVIV